MFLLFSVYQWWRLGTVAGQLWFGASMDS